MLIFLGFVELCGYVDQCFTSNFCYFLLFFLSYLFLFFWDSHYMLVCLMLSHKFLSSVDFFINLFSSPFFQLDNFYWSTFKFTDSFFYHLKSTHFIHFLCVIIPLNVKFSIGSILLYLFFYWELLFEDNWCHSSI